jgi:TatD DNase family protein
VDWLVVPGIDAASSRAAADLARIWSNRVFATAGLHPHEASRWPDEGEAIATLAEQAIAVGETGLDFYRNLSSPTDQVLAFGAQLDLAVSVDKPVVVHCRDAFEQVHQQIEARTIGSRVVLHCWTGGPRWTRRFLDLGCWFSFAGPIAFDSGETIRLAAALVPPDRALVETDTPFLTPPPHRGQPNEPGFVNLIGEALARVWGIEAEAVMALTSSNATKVFRR